MQMRSLLLAVALVVTAAPTAQAKKRHAPSHAKRAIKVTRRAPTRVAAAIERPGSRADVSLPAATVTHTAAIAPAREPATPPVAASPTPPVAATPAPPVARGPSVDQAGDDEVPGSRMKKR